MNAVIAGCDDWVLRVQTVQMSGSASSLQTDHSAQPQQRQWENDDLKSSRRSSDVNKDFLTNYDGEMEFEYKYAMKFVDINTDD